MWWSWTGRECLVQDSSELVWGASCSNAGFVPLFVVSSVGSDKIGCMMKKIIGCCWCDDGEYWMIKQRLFFKSELVSVELGLEIWHRNTGEQVPSPSTPMTSPAD